jgi:hypothetical protein
MTQEKDPAKAREQRQRLDRPDADASGHYGSLDQDLAYGGGRDPGNLGDIGRETTTHNYGGGSRRDEFGWEGGARPAEADKARTPDTDDEGSGGADPRR